MGNQFDQYLALLEPHEVVAPSGFTFVVRCLTHVDHMRLFGQLPLLKTDGKSSDELDAIATQRGEEIQRQIYESNCDGLKDPETGDLQRIPYEKVLSSDVAAIANAILNRGGLGTARAEAVRRALREPGSEAPARRDGAPVREEAGDVGTLPAG